MMSEEKRVQLLLSTTLSALTFVIAVLGFVIAVNSFKEKENNYDVNRDGKVTSTDYVLIKNYIMEE